MLPFEVIFWSGRCIIPLPYNHWVLPFDHWVLPCNVALGPLTGE